MKKTLILIILIMGVAILAQGQTDNFVERVKKAFPDIRFDLIKDDWQNDQYLKPYLEQRLLLLTHDSLSVLKNQATELNDTARINKLIEQMNEFFYQNIDDFKKLSTLLDSCIINSKSELLLALLLRNWDNTDPAKIKLANENRSELSRNSYYGKIFDLQLKNRTQGMTKIDYLYVVIDAMMPVVEHGETLKLKIEYSLFNYETIDTLVEIFKSTVKKVSYTIVENDLMDIINNLDFLQIISQSSAELQSIQELLNQ